MRRRLRIRLLIAIAILGSAHLYIWLRFVSAAELPEPWFAIATVAIIAAAPSLIVATFVLRRLPREAA